MIGTDRPDPDALLASIRESEAKASRGRLKVFFGMCPGVGKTYAMLRAARQKVSEGVEVVVGIVETHRREETEALIEGMPIVPRARVDHRGTTLEELDLEAILLWHPKLVLVDELAHTNAPGSRHPKRYQDVLELVDAGIDVYTTLNVQHVESRKDAVRQITGITVRETVPDSVLDIANEIELIDLTPEQLRQRLAEGKVYLGDRAATAAENFFRESNLTALREMSLRLTAEHVDRQLRTLRSPVISETWRSGDRLLVAVGASPYSAELIRWTRRYAASLEAPWIAVAVELSMPLSQEDEKRRTANLALARQLGAEVILTSATHVGEGLLKVAQQRGVTQIILGKPSGPRWRWLSARRSPVPWLIRNSGNIDLQLVRTQADDSPRETKRTKTELPWPQYSLALAIAVATTFACLILQRWIGYLSVALVYLLTVMLAGSMLGRGPIFLLAGLSALLWNYLFIPPIYTFQITATQDAMMFGMFFVVAVIVGHLTTRLRERELIERQRETRASALYQLTRALALVTSREEAVRVVMSQLNTVFQLKAATLLRDDEGAFNATAHPESTWLLPEKEEGVAAWAFQNKRPAGRTTETLPHSSALHLPLLVGDRVEGVLAVEWPEQLIMPPSQRELLEAFAAQLAVVAEKERLAAGQRRAQVLAESERLQKTLFDSVSHELKTPIAAIAAALDQPAVDVSEIRHANNRLRRTVDQLLDATRLESGLLKPNREWCDAVEIANNAVMRAGLPPDQVHVVAAADLPPMRVDASLLEQALSTLLHNAATHGASGEPTVFDLSRDGEFVLFQVSDRGVGLPPGSEAKVFEKFFRAAGAKTGGVGLGLSIALRLVEALGGSMMAENRPAGGARFAIRMPIGGQLDLQE